MRNWGNDGGVIRRPVRIRSPEYRQNIGMCNRTRALSFSSMVLKLWGANRQLKSLSVNVLPSQFVDFTGSSQTQETKQYETNLVFFCLQNVP